ncbi:EamA-like transporter family protein [Mycolicibacterium chubuense]|uniref:EamA-like transporter family protein n=2 Tax=Mycolicibacterium chubuense TaxID=1800 RepID=A0A0J6Y0K8_MYCCU|nr:EamA-like transporter family protein [Mycolicibacterium chubuense]SPX95939.1 integral membrane protein [Mycolicibacterium chubuense]
MWVVSYAAVSERRRCLAQICAVSVYSRPMPGDRAGYRTENLVLGAALTTAAFFCVALVGALAKVAGNHTSTGVLLLAQNAICLAAVAPVALRHGWGPMRTQRFGLHLLRAATGTACWYALFFAITLIPLANATLLTYSAPLWMPLIAWAVTRQRVATATWIGAGVGFAGVVLVLRPQGHGMSIGELSAFAGAVLLAVAMMSVRWLGATEPTLRILFYYFLLSTVMSIPVAALDFRAVEPQAWPWLFAVGVAQLLSQLLIVIAYRFAPAEKLGPFIYSVIVFTALIDWLFWDHRPTVSTYLGMALVIGGGLLAVRAKSTAAPAVPTAPQ